MFRLWEAALGYFFLSLIIFILQRNRGILKIFHIVVHTLGSYNSFFNFWYSILFFRLTKSWKFSCNFIIQITCNLVHGCFVRHNNYSFFHSTLEYFKLSWEAIGSCFLGILIFFFKMPETMFLIDFILKFMSLTFILL